VGSRAGLDGCRKSRSPLGFDPRTVLPLEIRHTDYPTILKNGVWKYGMGSSGSGQNTTADSYELNHEESSRVPFNVWSCSATDH
jgi:hypothetical protein